MTTTLRLDWVVLATIALSGWLVSAGSSAQMLTVEGKGTAQIAPEFAHMSALVSHTADTAAAAQAAVDRIMTRLLAGVDALPAAEDSIDAGQIRIQPRYRWTPAQKCKFQGYEATRVLHSSSPHSTHWEKRLRCYLSRVRRQSMRLNTAAPKARTLAPRARYRLRQGAGGCRHWPRRPASGWGTQKISAQAHNAPLCSEQ